MRYYYVDFLVTDPSLMPAFLASVILNKEAMSRTIVGRDDIVTLAAHTRIKPRDYAGGCSFLFFQGGRKLTVIKKKSDDLTL